MAIGHPLVVDGVDEAGWQLGVGDGGAWEPVARMTARIHLADLCTLVQPESSFSLTGPLPPR